MGMKYMIKEFALAALMLSILDLAHAQKQPAEISIGDCYSADKFGNIQAAIDAAGANGCVSISAGYKGGESYSNPHNISVIDHRSRGFGVWSVVQASRPVKDSDGKVIPLGNDVVLRAMGAADARIAVKPAITTSSTKVDSPGIARISVGTTENFYSIATMAVDRWRANQEFIAGATSGCPTSPPAGHFCIQDSTHIVANFQKAHTAIPYNLDNWGAIFFDSWAWVFTSGDDLKNVLSIVETRSGPHRGFTLYAYPDGSSSKALLNFDPSDSSPRYYGTPEVGIIFYGSNGGPGSCGPIRFRNNPTDDKDLALVDTCTGRIQPGSGNFVDLGTPPNGSLYYCSDCVIASRCVGGGTGAIAKRVNGVWICN